MLEDLMVRGKSIDTAVRLPDLQSNRLQFSDFSKLQCLLDDETSTAPGKNQYERVMI